MLRNPAADALSVSRSHPDQAPRDFEDLESWIQFIREIKNYSADRMRPRDRNGTEPVPSSAKNADSEYSALAERKEGSCGCVFPTQCAARRSNSYASAQ